MARLDKSADTARGVPVVGFRLDKRAADAVVWLLLLTMPFWITWIGGYTQLGTRVVILALAAMSLNFLLGYTGVLSFGHAAYFGLGSYGLGLTIKYLVPNTLVGMGVGIATAIVAAAIIGALIVRLRGIYFAMVTIAFGQVFYFIAYRWNNVTGGDDGLSGWHRLPIDLGFTQIDILNNDLAFYYVALFCFAVSVGIMALLLRSPFGRTLLAIRENGRHAQLLGAADRRRHLHRARGLHFEPDRKLGVLYRTLFHPRRAVLPARRPGHDQAEDHAMSLLQVDNVSKRFGDLVAVNGVSMTVEQGELRAVIGPNGAGKTTFFNLISGSLTPSAGKITFDNQDVTKLLPAQRVWRGMARTFQITEVFPELTTRENLRIAVEVAAGYRLKTWLSRDLDGEVRARVTDLLEMSGLASKGDRLVGELSHGDQRATEIMMALALKPRLLLLDEPTAGMGDQETYDITQLIRKLHKDQKLTIVLIEHDMRVVFHLADRIMVLAEGRPLAEGTPQEIAANAAVQSAYLGKAA